MRSAHEYPDLADCHHRHHGCGAALALDAAKDETETCNRILSRLGRLLASDRPAEQDYQGGSGRVGGGAIAENSCRRESGGRHVVGELGDAPSPPKEQSAVS